MDNKKWINSKVKSYFDWLMDRTDITSDSLTGWYGIATPFLGLMNDHIEIFIKKENREILLSDDGATLSTLAQMGIDVMKSKTRKNVIDRIKLNYDVEIEGGELITSATENTFPERKHALLSAIQEISDLKYTAKTDVVSMFSEEVGSFMEDLDIIYTPQFSTQGRTGMSFVFDFQIAGRKNELVIKTYNRLNQSDVERFLFSIHDISRKRQGLSNKAFNSLIIINDIDHIPNEKLLDVLREEDTRVLRWSQRSPDWKNSEFRVA